MNLTPSTAGHPKIPSMSGQRLIRSAVNAWEKGRAIRKQKQFTPCLDGVDRVPADIRWLTIR